MVDGYVAEYGLQTSLKQAMAKGAKFATVVSVMTSATIGFFFCIVIIIMTFREQISLFFTSSSLVLAAVDKIIILLGFTILLNSVQPVLSGYMGGGMIGGTAFQTLILATITTGSDWEKEEKKAGSNVKRWADSNLK